VQYLCEMMLLSPVVFTRVTVVYKTDFGLYIYRRWGKK